MCIAIYQPAGKELSKEIIQNCWTANNDGAGLLFTHNEILYAHKELTDLELFYDYYKHIVEAVGKTTPMVLHFRIKTHGLISLKNCHPFMVNDQIGFVHNGILSIGIPANSHTSDTFELNAQILQKLPDDFLNYQGCISLLESYCKGSKLVFLNNKGEHKIINEKLGVWEDGCWFSNYSFKSRTYVSPYPYQSNFDTSRAYNNYDDHGTYWNSRINRWTQQALPLSSTTNTNGPLSLPQASSKSIGNIQRGQMCLLCEEHELTSEDEKEFGVCNKCMQRLDWNSTTSPGENIR